MRSITALALLAFVATATSQASAQDISADPTYGDVRLSAGFTPDPHQISLTAGGSNPIKRGDCSYGNAASAPDVDLYWEGNGGTLARFKRSSQQYRAEVFSRHLIVVVFSICTPTLGCDLSQRGVEAS